MNHDECILRMIEIVEAMCKGYDVINKSYRCDEDGRHILNFSAIGKAEEVNALCKLGRQGFSLNTFRTVVDRATCTRFYTFSAPNFVVNVEGAKEHL
jgi:hypothetical protein